MRAKLFISILLIMTNIASGLNAQEKKSVPSKLNEATVFLRGAELLHSASAVLARGENELQVVGLSPSIDANSLKIKTSNGVVVSAYEFSIDYLKTAGASNDVAEKLENEIEIREKELLSLETDIEVNANLLALLQKGTEKNVDGSEKGLGIDELVKTMDYYKTKSKELHDAQAGNNRKKRELEETIAQLKAQLNQESVKNSKRAGVLNLVLAAQQDGKCDLSISYYTQNAGWSPYYDINATSTEKPIQITMKAKVRQVTGLDWEKIKLTLSTALPSNGKVAPLFTAWFLDFRQPVVTARREATKMMAQNTYSYEMAAPAPMEEEMEMMADMDESTMDDYVAMSDNELNLVYVIDLPYTIPGNGKEQSINLQTRNTEAEFKYYCAPKLDTETYLLAEISDWQSLNLLSAPANVTYDGTYVGETYIDARSTHEKLSLTLGTDKRVSVKREKLQDYSSTRVLGSDTRQTFAYKLTVRNNQMRSIKMVLKDQYPRTTQKSIEVELLIKETTPWTANVESLGVVTWEEDIKAGETKTYQICYSIKYPKGSNLTL